MDSQSVAPVIRWSEVLTPGLLAGFILTVVVLLVTLAVELANLRSVYVTNEAVEHTQAVELALQQILTSMVDAETGERGFIITGETSYLEPFNRARHTISAQMSELRELTADDPEHQADLDRLFAAIELKLKELADAIEQRTSSGFAAAQAAVAANVSKWTMDATRAIVARMKRREDAVTVARNTQAALSYRTARITGFATTGVAILAVIVLLIETQRYGAVRLRAARALETQQAQLREALQQKDDFVALVSHELRTPTNTIAGWAQILEEGAAGDDRAQRAIAAIRRNADSARQLIEDDGYESDGLRPNAPDGRGCRYSNVVPGSDRGGSLERGQQRRHPDRRDPVRAPRHQGRCRKAETGCLESARECDQIHTERRSGDDRCQVHVEGSPARSARHRRRHRRVVSSACL
jgi:CHASE3 domain sensor protein